MNEDVDQMVTADLETMDGVIERERQLRRPSGLDQKGHLFQEVYWVPNINIFEDISGIVKIPWGVESMAVKEGDHDQQYNSA